MDADSLTSPGPFARSAPTFAHGLQIARRFLRQHPRWLIGIGAIALVCVALYLFNSNTREARALRRIAQLGGYSGGPTAMQIAVGPGTNRYLARLLALLPSRTIVTGIVVEGKRATDDDIAEFVAVFPKIEQLDISNTKTSDAALASAAQLPALFYLLARHTDVTDAGVAKLISLQQLAMVQLDGTHITDAAVADLAKLPRLCRVHLSGTSITDAGLAHLAAHRGRLLHVDVVDTQVTDAGVAALQAAHPECQVVR
jgi:hypothetical protein